MKLFLLISLIAFQISGIRAEAEGGGQTRANESGWTVDTLHAHYAAILSGMEKLSEEKDKRYEQRFQAQEAASLYQRTIQNEFRGSLNDLSSTKVAKSEFDSAVKSIVAQIDSASKTTTEKIDSVKQNNATYFADIQHRLDLKEGSSSGISSMGGLIFAIVGAATSVIGIVLWVNGQRSRTSHDESGTGRNPRWVSELMAKIEALQPRK